jgi:YD repeat-containing protein
MAPPVPRGNLVSPVMVDPSGNIYLLSCDASGNLQVVALTDALKKTDLAFDASGALLISGASPSLMKPTPQSVEGNSGALAAGNSTFTMLTVPVGQYWRLTQWGVAYVGVMTGVIVTVQLHIPTGYPALYSYNPPIAGVWATAVSNILLRPGDTFGAYIQNAHLNDVCYLAFFGEQVY